jgi:hypothetical protein
MLSLLFAFVDLRNQFHIDHVFPVSRFTSARLRKAGISDENVGKLAQMATELPNLQLLEGAANNEKRAALPDAWLEVRYPAGREREHYKTIHLLGNIPADVDGFEAFWNARRERLREKIGALLNVDPNTAEQSRAAAAAG